MPSDLKLKFFLSEVKVVYQADLNSMRVWSDKHVQIYVENGLVVAYLIVSVRLD